MMSLDYLSSLSPDEINTDDESAKARAYVERKIVDSL